MNVKVRFLILMFILAIQGTAFADKGMKAHERVSQAKITLAEAVDIAQRHLSGQAYEAELEENSFSLEYEVDVLLERKKYEVTVDANTGEVKRVRQSD